MILQLLLVWEERASPEGILDNSSPKNVRWALVLLHITAAST